MKQLHYFIILFLTISACESPMVIPPQDPEHFDMEVVLNHLPFDQFNDFSKVVFRNEIGDSVQFKISFREVIVEETVVNSSLIDVITYNQFIFSYSRTITSSGLTSIIPHIKIITSFEDLPDLGFTELILCTSTVGVLGSEQTKLKIIPDQDYQNTVLNEEFTWMDETFENVYSDALIGSVQIDKVRLYYQPNLGIIGFVDQNSNPWIFDHFE